MGKILLLVLVSATCIAAVVRPWLGVVAYYVLAVFFPQAVWAWVFGGLRVSLYVALCTILGFMAAALTGRIDFSALRDRQHLCVAGLWVWVVASYVFSPYGANESAYAAVNSASLLGHMNKVFLFYFVAVLLIDAQEKILGLSMVMLATVVYYTYWANDFYFTGQMTGYRLAGPGEGSVYTDENTFAMVFVVGGAYLYFIGGLAKWRWLRWGLWALIPLSWHAAFLTGSRGGLLGLGGVTLFVGLRSRRRAVLVGLAAALVAAVVWQAGPYLLGRVDTIVKYEGESSAEGRVHAWAAGLGMMADYPLTGVGLGNFMPAFPDYSDKWVRVAHNTVVQFGAECGIPAALLYLYIVWTSFTQGRGERERMEARGFPATLRAAHHATECGLYGFFVCSLFLNLATFEIFYYLLVLRAAWRRVVATEIAPQGLPVEAA